MWLRKSLTILRKNVFFCFWLGVFTHDDDGDKKKGDGDVVVFNSFYVFVLFFKIWDE
jgi:hypothetical protein